MISNDCLEANPNFASNQYNPGFKVWRDDLRKRNFELRLTWKFLWSTTIEISEGFVHNFEHVFGIEIYLYF